MKKLILLVMICLIPFSCNRNEFTQEPISVDNFAARHVNLTDKIHGMLAEKYLNDKKFIFDGDKISKCSNENELLIYLKSIGFNNGDDIKFLKLIKEDYSLINQVTTNNKSFTNLKTSDKQNLIKEKIIFYEDKNKKQNSQNQSAKSSCAAKWNTAIDRCKITYAVESGLSAVAGVFTGGVGGLIAYAGATAHWSLCLKWSRDDYYDCQNGN